MVTTTLSTRLPPSHEKLTSSSTESESSPRKNEAITVAPPCFDSIFQTGEECRRAFGGLKPMQS